MFNSNSDCVNITVNLIMCLLIILEFCPEKLRKYFIVTAKYAWIAFLIMKQQKQYFEGNQHQLYLQQSRPLPLPLP